MIEFAKCPKCGEELIVLTTEGVDYRGDSVEIYLTGYCPNHCYNHYRWSELFEYVDFKNVKGRE